MFKPEPFRKSALAASKSRINTKDLYPSLSSEQQDEAVFFLTGYLNIVSRIFDRIRNLTESDKSARV